MSVPAKRRSRSRARRAKSHKRTVVVTGLIKCANCSQMKPRHRACPSCGQYKGRQVVDMDKRKNRAERKRKKGR